MFLTYKKIEIDQRPKPNEKPIRLKWSYGVFGAKIKDITKHLVKTMKHAYLHTIFALLLAGFFTSHAHSFNEQDDNIAQDQQTLIEEQEIIIPLAEKITQTPAVLPIRGQSKQKIKSLFGEPNKLHDAKGKPPIERWDYDGFSVYFESHAVIHTVIKRSMQP